MKTLLRDLLLLTRALSLRGYDLPGYAHALRLLAVPFPTGERTVLCESSAAGKRAVLHATTLQVASCILTLD